MCTETGTRSVRVGIGAERENAEPEGHGVKQGLLRGEAVGIVREEVVDFLVDFICRCTVNGNAEEFATECVWFAITLMVMRLRDTSMNLSSSLPHCLPEQLAVFLMRSR